MSTPIHCGPWHCAPLYIVVPDTVPLYTLWYLTLCPSIHCGTWHCAPLYIVVPDTVPLYTLWYLTLCPSIHCGTWHCAPLYIVVPDTVPLYRLWYLTLCPSIRQRQRTRDRLLQENTFCNTLVFINKIIIYWSLFLGACTINESVEIKQLHQRLLFCIK